MGYAPGPAMAVQPFEVHVSDDELADLDRRLAATRFIEATPDGDRASGVPVGFLRTLVEQWRGGFDWRALERRINSLDNVLVDVRGLRLHCAVRKGAGPAPVGIVVVHGWPSSFVELLDLAERLADPATHGGDPADSFDVVLPSIPGFAWSEAPRTLDWASPEDDGDAIAEAMTELGSTGSWSTPTTSGRAPCASS